MRVGVPERQPFGAQTKHQADAELFAPVPASRVAQRFITAPERQLLEPIERCEFASGPSGGTGNCADLSSDLAGVLGNIEARDPMYSRAALEQTVGNLLIDVTQRGNRADARNPHRGPLLHR